MKFGTGCLKEKNHNHYVLDSIGFPYYRHPLTSTMQHRMMFVVPALGELPRSPGWSRRMSGHPADVTIDSGE